MPEKIFTAKKLTKKYKAYALKQFDMEICKGDIYGFIGRNGAGKTTLMRILTGRAVQSGGDICLFGESNPDKLYLQRRRVGAIIEGPAFYPGMTAEDNLEVIRLQYGIKEKKCIKELLKTVGLEDTGTKKAKDFSLGMKQRLGIAVVLLGSPELLLLDEPINALDPSGVIEIRNLLKRLREFENKTILISSHNLPELYQTATDYIIIHNGEVKDILTHEELEEHCKSYISIESTDISKLAMVLEKELKTGNFQVMPDKSISLYDLPGNMEQFGQVLYDNGVVVTKLAAVETSLEEYYMRVIGGDTNDGFVQE